MERGAPDRQCCWTSQLFSYLKGIALAPTSCTPICPYSSTSHNLRFQETGDSFQPKTTINNQSPGWLFSENRTLAFPRVPSCDLLSSHSKLLANHPFASSAKSPPNPSERPKVEQGRWPIYFSLQIFFCVVILFPERFYSMDFHCNDDFITMRPQCLLM